MPLYDMNLKQLISQRIKEKNNKPPFFDLFEFLFIAKQLITAVNHLQKNNIVHRDLKYDNIFLKKNLKLVLADFGCCFNFKENDINDFKIPYQFDGIPKGGCPSFLPPEIINTKFGKNIFLDYSKSDIFSTGIVLYLMLSGKDKNEKENWPFDEKNNYIDLKPPYASSAINLFIKGITNFDLKKRTSTEEAFEEIKEMYLGVKKKK